MIAHIEQLNSVVLSNILKLSPICNYKALKVIKSLLDSIISRGMPLNVIIG
jgi:hypothetical protein